MFDPYLRYYDGKLIQEVIRKDSGQVEITVDVEWEIYDLVLSPKTHPDIQLDSLCVGDEVTLLVHHDYLQDTVIEIIVSGLQRLTNP